MSTVVFHTEPAIFTFALPVPTAFDPEYLKYAQKIRDLAVCVQDVPEGKNPRLQVTAEYPMDECGDLGDFAWTVSLFYTDHPLDGEGFPEREAVFSYRGGDGPRCEATRRLEQYASEYGRLVFTFHTPDTFRLIEGEKIIIQQDAPVGV